MYDNSVWFNSPVIRNNRYYCVCLAWGLFCLANNSLADEQIGPTIVKQIVGHRGSCADRPENTLSSIRRAIEAHATAVEIDVRSTKDGQLVLMHDELVDKTTDGKGKLNQFTLTQVQQFDAGKWFQKDGKYQGERVPTLAEALKECHGKVDVLLDLKEQEASYMAAVVDAVSKNGEPIRTIFGVRSVEQARFFRRAFPQAQTLGLIAKPDDLEAYVAEGVTTIRLWPKWLTDQSLVQRVRTAGARLHLGVSRGEPQEVWPLLKFRPDSMSSDDPAHLRSTIRNAPAELFQVSGFSEAIPVIIDTDIGGDIDDAFALALATSMKELRLCAVTTVGGQADERARLVCRFLTNVGYQTIPVAAGLSGPRLDLMDAQVQYQRHPSVVEGKTSQPLRKTAVDLLYETLKRNPGEITIIALGPLTNIAKLLELHPDVEPLIKRIVVMGGAIRVGYSGVPPAVPEWNIAGDIPAAQQLFQSKIPLTLIPLDATSTLKLDQVRRERLFAARNRISYQLQALYELWGREDPVLFDSVAVANAFSTEFCDYEDLRLEVTAKGLTQVSDTSVRSIQVATSTTMQKFLDWHVGLISESGGQVLPARSMNPSQTVAETKFPARFHYVENFDSETEKRSRVVGKTEIDEVASSRRPAVRAELTQDLDRQYDDPGATYRAIILRPVPSPMVGPNPRLTFRYKLNGTDQIRIQIHSLSQRIHRSLTLNQLPEMGWHRATVDLSQMKLPDGSGEVISADELIGYIQFYIDPQAELLIDEVILHEAMNPDELRPFPQSVIFAGGFDTGEYGTELSGEFELVPHNQPGKGRFLKCVVDPESGQTNLRIGLRGHRRLGPNSEISFRYLQTTSQPIEVRLSGPNSKLVRSGRVYCSVQGEWTTVTVRLESDAATPVADPLPEWGDQLEFRLHPGTELSIDDLLLFVP